MTSGDKDKLPMLSDIHPRSNEENVDPRFQAFASQTRSASLSIPMSSEPYENETNLVGFTGPLRSERRTPQIQMSGPLYISRGSRNLFQPGNGVMGHKLLEPKIEKFPSFRANDQNDWMDEKQGGKNEHLMRSGQLGMCNDPYCTTCPTYYTKAARQKYSKASGIFDPKFHNVLYGDAKGWARKFISFVGSFIPGVMNPHSKFVQQWNKFFVFSCLVAIFIDPLFFLLLCVNQDSKCIFINWPMTTTIVAFRSVTDFIYWLNMLLQFRLAYVNPESRVVGAGELIDHPKKIARNYLLGFFAIDLFVALPLPQIIVLLVLPNIVGDSEANYAKNLLRAAVLLQYAPRLYRFLPLLVGHSPSGFIFETAWANFVINLLTFVLSGHVIGASWYLLGLQRVNQCLRDACRDSYMHPHCNKFIDCGHGVNSTDFKSDDKWSNWTTNTNASNCFAGSSAQFDFGIYKQIVNLTTDGSVITRYVYSLFWGFQQISTLAGNQTPSYFVPEVLFTMAIIGLGLLLFAFLIGNMQNFLQSLGRRRLEMSLRRRDVEQWMRHRRLPLQLRR